MGILRVDHPDILEFIRAKEREGDLNNFNLSVALTERFMQAGKDEEFPLIAPHTKDVVETLPAREVFELLVRKAWESGDPGIIFLDRINRDNPNPDQGDIESTNPCGEQPLLPYDLDFRLLRYSSQSRKNCIWPGQPSVWASSNRLCHVRCAT